MSATAIDLLAGFANPVDQSQQAFRAVLDAMSHPGTAVSIVGPDEHPNGVSPAAAAVLLALADYVTPIWYGASFNVPQTTGYFRFHTGAPLADAPGKAAFALLEGDLAARHFNDYAIGTPEYPDRSTTLIIEVGAMNGDGPALLSGPGLAQPTHFGVEGLDESLWPHLTQNRQLFPLGIDVIFTAGDKVAALPRSTRIEV